MAYDNSMELADIFAPIHQDLQRVNDVVRRALSSTVPLVEQLGQHIIFSGGKRVRPAVLLLCARACGYEGTEHVKLAAATEIVHTATLLHDDVVDASELRRGQSTANTIWGNEASVLVGDFLYSRSTQLLVEAQRLDILDVVSDAANNIAEGELLQLVNARKSNISEEAYFEIIRSKTARLFEASAQIGALIADASPSWEQALAKYGIHLGNAFQLIDDVLDYQGDVDAIGKNVGDDLADGKTTLPLIYAMRHGNAEQANVIRQAIEKGDISQLAAVAEAIESTRAIEYTSSLAQRESQQAIIQIACLPDSEYRQALKQLALFVVERAF
jgi:octaprenyl-diphosphate synthase